MDDITIKIGRSWRDLRANKSYDYCFTGDCDDPYLERNLFLWAKQSAYWNRELLIGGIEYHWPEEGEDKVLKPKYVVKHIMYCIDLHRSFYELS